MAFQVPEMNRGVVEACCLGMKIERGSSVYLCTPTQAYEVATGISKKSGCVVTLPKEIAQLAIAESALCDTSNRKIISSFSSAERFEVTLTGSTGLLFGEPPKIAKIRKVLESLPPGHPFGDAYPYQKAGVLAGLAGGGRMLLGDEMGLGKSCQSLLIVECGFGPQEILRSSSEGPALVLCVAPKSMVYEWACEAKRWAPSFKTRMLRTKREAVIACELLASGAVEHGIVIVSWGLFPLIVEELRKPKWSGMILDEDHAAKETTSNRTRAQLEIGMGVPLKLGLSGTPMLNRPMELWPLLHFLDPVAFPSPLAFGKRYGGPMDVRGRFRGASRTAELQEVLKSYMVRRMKKNVMPELPGQNIRTIRLPAIASLGNAKDIVERMRDSEDASGLTAFGAMRRATGESKIDDTVDLVMRALAKEESVVVFFTHKAVREGLYEGLIKAGVEKKEIGVIVGSTSSVRRKTIKNDFQTGKIKVILGSEAARDGITLTYGRVTIHVEPWFSPDLDRQAMARVNRIGQTEQTWHLFLLREGSTDEHIARLSEKKRQWISEVLPGDD
jgi:SWI/SNF-related matrix-associated actin-dependent regulator 1 of chromatin subfamily A